MRKEWLILLVVVLILPLFYFWLKQPRIFVGGTEYSPGDNGRTFVQILSDAFTPVNNAVCKVTIYYPDNSYFVKEAYMLPLGERGLYYYDFIAPDTTGVYMVSVECVYPNNKTDYYPSNPAGCKASSGYSTVGATSVSNLYYIYYPDNYQYYCKSDVLYLNFSANLNDYSFVYNGKFAIPRNDSVSVYIWNKCINDWELSSTFNYYTPMVSKYYNNGTCYLPNFKFVGTEFYVDYFTLSVFTPSSTTINNIRGGGEVHIKYLKAQVEIDQPQAKVVS